MVDKFENLTLADERFKFSKETARCIEIRARNDFKLGGEYDRREKRKVREWDKASQEHIIESGLT